MVIVDTNYHWTKELKWAVELVPDEKFDDEKLLLDFVIDLGTQKLFSDIFGSIGSDSYGKLV